MLLPDDLLEEIFFRLPSDEPVCLVCTSLTSKLWLGRLTGPHFRGRYREFHGAPPMLGFLYSRSWDCEPEERYHVPLFVSTTEFGARVPDNDWGYPEYVALDCRHGRVLLADCNAPMPLVVWDPMPGRRTKLEGPKAHNFNLAIGSGAAVLCAVAGRDHRACHQGPFRVVFFGMSTHGGQCVIHLSMSSPETGGWSEPCPDLDLGNNACIMPVPPVFIQNTLYFMHTRAAGIHIQGILKYDLGSNCLSLIDVPMVGVLGFTTLMAMEDDSLGFALVGRLTTLYLWSRQMGSDGVASWTKRRVIDLKSLLPIQDTNRRLTLIGSVEGSDITFVTTDLGIYEISLKSLRWKKLWKREKFRSLIPYMSFHNPQGISICSFFCDLGTTLYVISHISYWNKLNIECLIWQLFIFEMCPGKL